ncbi:hypothetical protein HUU40_26720 [candidate division KSB1 bacterium]|nr:hypothetical protein [candidate division KSB1 bacterium]
MFTADFELADFNDSRPFVSLFIMLLKFPSSQGTGFRGCYHLHSNLDAAIAQMMIVQVLAATLRFFNRIQKRQKIQPILLRHRSPLSKGG